MKEAVKLLGRAVTMSILGSAEQCERSLREFWAYADQSPGNQRCAELVSLLMLGLLVALMALIILWVITS